MSFSNGFVMSQNKMAVLVWDFVQGPLGEMVVHYDNIYKIK